MGRGESIKYRKKKENIYIDKGGVMVDLSKEREKKSEQVGRLRST